MILLDTNIIFALLSGDSASILALEKIGEANAAVSIVTYAECSAVQSKKEFRNSQIMFRRMKVIHITPSISKRFIELIITHRPRSKWIPDALIAATALEYGCKLFTENRKDFDFIHGLSLYAPS
jgi:predicted nucleic acid-binding protein